MKKQLIAGFFITCLFLWIFYPNHDVKKVFLPKPRGSFFVGTISFELTDTSRKMMHSSDKRRWMMQAFFPTAPHTEHFAYQPETLTSGLVDQTQVLCNSKPDAQILDTEHKLPVVIFVPGFGNCRQDYTILCEELASFGCIVLAFDQPEVSRFSRYKDGTVIQPKLINSYKIINDRDFRYKYFDQAMRACILDIEYLIEHIPFVDKTFFENKMNPEKIALIGHSLGGNVAHTLGFSDRRIKAVIDIDSKITDRPILGRMKLPENKFNTPVLFVRGMLSYQDFLPEDFAWQNSWAPFVEHSAFCDSAFLVEKIPSLANKSLFQIFFYWLQKKQFINAVDYKVSGQSIDVWFCRYRSKIISFFKQAKVL